MLRKKRLKCGRIPVRLFLACHQKSNTFKCKQFCCAKPMCACLFMGCAPRPRNAAPQYLACGSQSVARHIRAQTRRSLNECALVRLASQAVPSPNPVGFYHCGAAIGSLIKKSNWSLAFTLQESGKRVYFYLFKSIESIAAGGQPQGLSLQTVGNEQFEDFMPLRRQWCVEVAAPYAPIKLCRFRGQMISAPTYFERSETNPSVALRQLPFRGA